MISSLSKGVIPPFYNIAVEGNLNEQIKDLEGYGVRVKNNERLFSDQKIME